MEPITQGAVGAAVEDIQERLARLGYEIAAAEREAGRFDKTTALAVLRFRAEHGLAVGDEVDTPTWAALVDEGWELGDRTLYLRLPNYHGADVRQLQERLNILGFSCGPIDGTYGVHTEAAVKLFQESCGSLPDGMAFPDTFDAIERLRHVWAGKPANGPHPQGGMGFARAASVLEGVSIALAAEDPIARNVAGRVWNLAHATVDNCKIDVIHQLDEVAPHTQAVLVLTSSTEASASAHATGVGSVVLDDTDSLPLRLRAAVQASAEAPHRVQIVLPVGESTFTMSDAQTFAVLVLDAVCVAFDEAGA